MWQRGLALTAVSRETRQIGRQTSKSLFARPNLGCSRWEDRSRFPAKCSVPVHVRRIACKRPPKPSSTQAQLVAPRPSRPIAPPLSRSGPMPDPGAYGGVGLDALRAEAVAQLPLQRLELFLRFVVECAPLQVHESFQN